MRTGRGSDPCGAEEDFITSYRRGWRFHTVINFVFIFDFSEWAAEKWCNDTVVCTHTTFCLAHLASPHSFRKMRSSGAPRAPQPSLIQILVCKNKVTTGAERNLELHFVKSQWCCSRTSLLLILLYVFSDNSLKNVGTFVHLKFENLGFWHTVSFKRAHKVLETHYNCRTHNQYPSTWFCIMPELESWLPSSSPPHPAPQGWARELLSWGDMEQTQSPWFTAECNVQFLLGRTRVGDL